MNDEVTKPAARIVGGPPRTKTVALQWPVEFDGKTYNEIEVRRLTAADVDTFVKAVRAGDQDARLPYYNAPDEVLDAMDADDSAALNEAAAPFTPRAFQAEGAQESGKSASLPDTSPAS